LKLKIKFTGFLEAWVWKINLDEVPLRSRPYARGTLALGAAIEVCYFYSLFLECGYSHAEITGGASQVPSLRHPQTSPMVVVVEEVCPEHWAAAH
jgi:hypothetical protein